MFVDICSTFGVTWVQTRVADGGCCFDLGEPHPFAQGAEEEESAGV
jgi:hypothetical protein